MKIAGSNIQMNSQSTSVKQESLNVSAATSTSVSRRSANAALATGTKLDLSGAGMSLAEAMREQARQMQEAQTASVQNSTPASSPTAPTLTDRKMDLLDKLLEMLLGSRMKFMEDLRASRERSSQSSQSSPLRLPRMSMELTRTQTVFTETHEVSERQAVSYSVKGQVRTDDGRAIDIDLKLNLSSSFVSKTQTQTMTESAAARLVMEPVGVDPLIINFGAASAGLSSKKFEFDIDADGTPDQISKLLAGSGFLALDKNGDGKINDGGELFGTKSGDGFKDLAEYDSDGNGWIDENDPIFDSLRIWAKNDDGTDRLLALGEVGIGAISLANVKTAMNIRAESNVDGILQKTGFFVREDGTAGTIQHVDFVV